MSFWQKYFVVLVGGLLCVLILRAFVLETYQVGESSKFLETREGDILLGLKLFFRPANIIQESERGQLFIIEPEGSPYLWPSRLWSAAGESLRIDSNGNLIIGSQKVGIRFPEGLANQEYILKEGEIFVYPLPESVLPESLEDYVFLTSELTARVITLLFRRHGSAQSSLIDRLFVPLPKMKAID